MKHNLTPAQIERVFALYLLHKCRTRLPNAKEWTQLTIDGHSVLSTLQNNREGREFQILLTPLSKITVEDVKEVAKLNYSAITTSGGAKFGPNDYTYCMHNGYENELFLYRYTHKIDLKGLAMTNFRIFLYLIQQGYDIPLFIAPEHPDNGKTLIELGLAVDKTEKEVTV